MAEFEHGPRSTDEARAALHRLVQNRWHGGQEPNTHHRACFTIPCDQRRDADCILSDVIEERDRLRVERDAYRRVAVAAAEFRDAATREAGVVDPHAPRRAYEHAAAETERAHAEMCAAVAALDALDGWGGGPARDRAGAVTDRADAIAFAVYVSRPDASPKARRFAPVAAQYATGRVVLPTIGSVNVPQPKRDRLDDAWAALAGVTPAQLADARELLPDPNAESRPRCTARVIDGPARRVERWATVPAVDVVARELQFERREWTDGERRWATWEPALPPYTPAEAWELLCERLDLGATWVDSPRRRFQRDIGTVHLAHPPTALACIAFASDAPNVLAAEAIARETVRRAERVVWRMDSKYHRALGDSSRRIKEPAWWAPIHALGYEFGGSDDTSVTLVAPELGP
jgi:hypothetical protein